MFCFQQLCASKVSHILRHALCISCCIVHRQFRFYSWTCWLHTFLVTNFLSHNLNGYYKFDELAGLLTQLLLHHGSHCTTGNTVQSGSLVALVKPTFNMIWLLLPTKQCNLNTVFCLVVFCATPIGVPPGYHLRVRTILSFHLTQSHLQHSSYFCRTKPA